MFGFQSMTTESNLKSSQSTHHASTIQGRFQFPSSRDLKNAFLKTQRIISNCSLQNKQANANRGLLNQWEANAAFNSEPQGRLHDHVFQFTFNFHWSNFSPPCTETNAWQYSTVHKPEQLMTHFLDR